MTMKKAMICMLMMLAILLTGCNIPTNETGEPSKDPDGSISIHSVQELQKMNEMLSCKDEQEVNDYLRSIEDGGAHSTLDLSKFLSIVDSIPYLKLIDGNISWISYSKGQSKDTGREYEILYISTESEDGDWCRIEYLLSVTDILSEISLQGEKGEFSSSTLQDTVRINESNINIYSETKSAHPSGVGKTINWMIDVDGVLARVVYYAKAGDKDISVFNNVKPMNGVSWEEVK